MLTLGSEKGSVGKLRWKGTAAVRRDYKKIVARFTVLGVGQRYNRPGGGHFEWTFWHTGIFIFAFGSFQHPE